MPQINILPIENTQLPEVKEVSDGSRSRNSDEFGRHMAQEDNRQRRDDDNTLRSNTAANRGNSSQKSTASSTERANENDEATRSSVNASAESRQPTNDKMVDEKNSPRADNSGEKVAPAEEEVIAVPTNENSVNANKDKGKVTPDILLSVLGASEKVLVNKDVTIGEKAEISVENAATTSGKIEVTGESAKDSADKSGIKSAQLVGIDERLKALVAKAERPDNRVDADYVSPIAALRGGDSNGEKAKLEQAAATQAMKNQVTGSTQDKATSSNNDKAQKVEVAAQENITTLKELASTEVSEQGAAETDTKTLSAKSEASSAIENRAVENKNKQQVVDTNNKATQSTYVNSVSDKASNAMSGDASKHLNSTSEIPDDIAMQARTVADGDSDQSSKDKLGSAQPKTIQSANESQPKHQLNPVSQAVAESLDTENPNDKAVQVVKATTEKVGQSSNSAQNHTRFVNQSTQDAVQLSESSTDSASQDNSDQQTDAKAYAQKDIVLNQKNGEQSNTTDKGIAETVRANEKLSTNQSHNATSVSSTDAAVLDKVMDKLSSEQIQTTNVRNSSQVASETLNLHRKDFVDQVKDKVMVMINKRLQQLEIRLDPAELGSMQVKLNMQNEQAAVSIVVQNSHAKEALDQNIQKLRDMLQESGVDVGDANIEHREASEQQEFAQSRSEGKHHQTNEETEVRAEDITRDLYKASSTGIDYYA
ncbi:flagellar hook-length control protein FliK [Thalassotalea fusca]